MRLIQNSDVPPPEFQERPNRSLASRLFWKMTTFSLLLFTGFCFLKAGAGLVSDDRAVSLTEVEAAIPARTTQQRFQTTPIQKMRPGMRVLGRNPDRWDTQPVVEPDPVSWRLVSVRMEQQPGQFVLGQLLRPTNWIRQNAALPGAVIQLEIPEIHVAGDAEVLSIADCPPIRRGAGSVVTVTFQHVSNEVINVFVEGEAEPIGATSQHPFWSRDRNAFVPAGELRIGEELKTALGTSTRVTSIEIRAGPETVYGLEVADEHVYQITNAGLLVHNVSVTSPYQIDTLHGPRWKDPVTGKFVKAPTGNAGRLRDPKTGRFISDPANPPSPYKFTDAQRRAAWKRLAQDPNSPLTPAQRAEIEARGSRGPQRVNEFGELETMELFHEPIPLREGGTNVVPRWPAEHAAIYPHRQLKKRP
ncbi:polymorphic toxin-type HINT domain-containing protein [Gimesia chilikensis]|uniref:polymorphic toxin-type HINT domain-containing protein n=1 Tax=Gimesia chilikensis TaxID=2605989 RepID=UPI0011881F71|nr:polymorphic toxin-type HINT domain-containing protein [Gimesia chilikensis]QDT85336.1 hypothetical protein MalM14_30040 [Gimesia chilikensis]